MEAGQFVQTIEHRQGLKVACLEEIGYRNGWLSAEALQQQAGALAKTGYGQYLKQVLKFRDDTVNVLATPLPGVMIIEPKVFGDHRGFFKETFQIERYREVGIDLPFVQDNHSRSPEAFCEACICRKVGLKERLVSCNRVPYTTSSVDVDPSSNTFGQYVGLELSAENHRQLWIPPGYAHGFCVLSEFADFQYKCTDLYVPEDEGGLIWNDPEVGIPWPGVSNVIR